MKIGIRDADIPGNQTIGSDLDLLVCHDQRAIEQREIADPALAIFADRKRTACVTRNMFADDDSARSFAPKLSEDLGALAIKSFAKLDIRRNWLRPPVVFDASIFSNVAQCVTSCWEFSRRIEFRVNPAARDQLWTTPFLDEASVLEHNDLIKTMDRRQAMRRDQSCPPLH